MRAAAAVFAFLVLCPQPAWAHAMVVEAKVLPFWQIRVESWYETGDAPGGARVVVQRGDGGRVTEGRLDTQGVFAFECREAGPLQIVVTDGLGHRAETTIAAERLTLRTIETVGLCLTPPPSLLAGPLLAPPPPSEQLMVVKVTSQRTGPPLGRLLLGAAILMAMAGAWALWAQSRKRKT